MSGASHASRWPLLLVATLLVALLRSSSSSLTQLVVGLPTMNVRAFPTDACACTPPTLEPDAHVKVAILVTANCPRGILADNPNYPTTSGCAIDRAGPATVVRYIEYGIDMYVRKMQRVQPMPLKNGNNVTFEYTYINLGYANLGAPDWYAFSRAMGNVTSGFLADVLTTDKYGGPFSFVIPPSLTSNAPLLPASGTNPAIPSHMTTLLNICEAGWCIAVHPYANTPNVALCYIENGVLPQDCIDRGRVAGSRRFDNMLGVLFDTTPAAASAFETYKTLGVGRMAIISESGDFNGFSNDVLPRSIQLAQQVNIEVVLRTKLVRCSPAAGNCPSTPGQELILPNGMTAIQWATAARDAGAEAVMMLSTSSGHSSKTMASIFDGFHAIDWTPSMINFVGNGDVQMRPFMTDYNDHLYAFTSSPWDLKLSGPMYRNVKTPANFELFPAEDVLDGPAVFAREYRSHYLAAEGTPFTFGTSASIPAVFGFHALTIVQKVVEAGLTDDVTALATASLRVSTPSVFHQLVFDTSGRTSHVNEILLQYHPAFQPSATQPHRPLVVNPFNIGEPIVYPLPKWNERTFAPRRWSQSSEVVMAVMTGLSIGVCLAVIIFVVSNAQHPVIRAATPSFCSATLTGAILMLLSNFFNTLVVSDADCAASIWLLTLGFSICFVPLFAKTFRIWKIFFTASKRLVVVKMRDAELFAAVVGFLCIDLVINAVWSSVGMKSVVIVVDELRPSHNYLTCDFSNTLGFVWAHIAIKSALLLFGIALTWMVRDSPSQFNESALIGICIYNISIVVCFVVPILHTQLGGRQAFFLIRAFAIIFVVLTTVGVLYIPKIRVIYFKRKRRGGGGGTQKPRVVFDQAQSDVGHGPDYIEPHIFGTHANGSAAPKSIITVGVPSIVPSAARRPSGGALAAEVGDDCMSEGPPLSQYPSPPPGSIETPQAHDGTLPASPDPDHFHYAFSRSEPSQLERSVRGPVSSAS